jgi:hypothetical protein
MLLGHKITEYGDGEVTSCVWVFSRSGGAFQVDPNDSEDLQAESILSAAADEIARASIGGPVIPSIGPAYYSGPGRPFLNPPCVRWSRSYVKVYQRGGWDV